MNEKMIRDGVSPWIEDNYDKSSDDTITYIHT